MDAVEYLNDEFARTPEQIKEADRLYSEKCREVAELKSELKEAER